MDNESPKTPRRTERLDRARLDRVLLIGIATALVFLLGLTAANLAITVTQDSNVSESTKAAQDTVNSQQSSTTEEGTTAPYSAGSNGGTSEELVQVPNMLDLMEANAKAILAAVGLGCDSLLIDSPPYSWGHVVTFHPKAGTWVPVDTMVTIEVGGVEVPDVIGEHINDAGLSIGPNLLISVIYEPTPNQADWNIVLAQDPSGGHVLPPGSTVKLTIGKKALPINPTPLTTSTTKLQITIPPPLQSP